MTVNPFHPGAKVKTRFGDGATFDREIERVTDDGGFKLVGGWNIWRPFRSDDGWKATTETTIDPEAVCYPEATQ